MSQLEKRHQMHRGEADLFLQAIRESWNLQIGIAEEKRPEIFTGISDDHYRAVMASLINLQHQYSYDEILSALMKHPENPILIEVANLFSFLKCCTLQI